ncbi:MAG: hypothetical protein K6G42_03410, partial [Lachnospiraceae bacterium]|nr:hypothetical protein [Lachnospiraceae bacterium]
AKTEATGNEADKEPETSAPEEEAEPATEEAKTASDQTASGNAPEELPAFGELKEEDAFLAAINKAILKNSEGMYTDGALAVPVYIPVEQNFDDPEDITAWGYFITMNFDLEGTTLMNKSGGVDSGLMHLKETDDGYEVTSMDITLTDDDLKELCDKNGFDYKKFALEQETQDQAMAAALCSYIDGFDLPIDSYQFDGWDKVMLHTYRTNLTNTAGYVWSAIYGTQFDHSALEKITGKDLTADVLDMATGICAGEDPFYLVMEEKSEGEYILTPDAVYSFQAGTLEGDEKVVDEAMKMREADKDGNYTYNSGDWGEVMPFTEVENIEIDNAGNATLTGKMGTKGEDETSNDFTIKFSKDPGAPTGCAFEELVIK